LISLVQKYDVIYPPLVGLSLAWNKEMDQKEIETWIDAVLPKHKTLTNTVVSIVESLLEHNDIDYLAVSGRTKDAKSIKEKISRKSYQHPDKQITDLSGIRIIAYFESDVDRISKLIESSFNVDEENSLSKDLFDVV
jgi:GTP pyrophosphokinase